VRYYIQRVSNSCWFHNMNLSSRTWLSFFVRFSRLCRRLHLVYLNVHAVWRICSHFLSSTQYHSDLPSLTRSSSGRCSSTRHTTPYFSSLFRLMRLTTVSRTKIILRWRKRFPAWFSFAFLKIFLKLMLYCKFDVYYEFDFNFQMYYVWMGKREAICFLGTSSFR